MSSFKLDDFKIKLDESDPKKVTITPYEKSTAPVVKDFSLKDLKRSGDRTYEANKAKYGARAATDSMGIQKAVKDQRFALNPLSKQALSIEAEELRAIQERVSHEVESRAKVACSESAKAGYEEGIIRGKKQALQEAQAAAEINLKRFEEIVIGFENAKADIFKANERFLMELIYRIGRMVTLKELQTDKEYLSRLTQELVSSMSVRDHIRIKISLEDADTIASLKESTLKVFGELKNLQIEASALVERGGCLVETEWHAIDVNMETQFQKIHEALIGQKSEVSK